MKSYTIPRSALQDHPHPHPLRTAYKRKNADPMNFDVVCRVWSNRRSLAMSIRMQERGEKKPGNWAPVVPLKISEGY